MVQSLTLSQSTLPRPRVITSRPKSLAFYLSHHVVMVEFNQHKILSSFESLPNQFSEIELKNEFVGLVAPDDLLLAEYSTGNYVGVLLEFEDMSFRGEFSSKERIFRR